MDILRDSHVFVESRRSRMLYNIGIVAMDGQVVTDPLSHFDRYLSALSLNKLILEREIVKLRRAQNDSLPVNALPQNVLTNIFSLAADDIEDKTLRLIALSQVCSSWRAIVVDRPSLWNTFGLVHPEATQLHLDRSGSLSLHVVIDKPDDLPESVLEMFNPVYPQLYRVKSLNIATWNDDRLVEIFGRFGQWADPDLPLQLTEVSLRGTTAPVADYFFSGIPPFNYDTRIKRHVYKLTSLTLNNVKLNTLADPSSPSALRRLELSFQKSSQIPLSSVLARFLIGCPMLEVLVLRTTAPMKYAASGYNLHRPLTHLKSVTIEGVGTGTVDALSQMLWAILPSPSPTQRTQDGPSPARLNRPSVDLIMSTDEACSGGWFRNDDPRRKTPRYLTHPKALRRLHVSKSTDDTFILYSFYDTTGTDAADVRFVFQGVKCNPAPHVLSLAAWPLDVRDVEVLCFMQSTGTELRLHNVDWRTLLAQMPALATVEVQGAELPVAGALFSALTPADGGSENGLLCPQLSRVSFVNTAWRSIDHTEALAKFMHIREELVNCRVNIELRGVLV